MNNDLESASEFSSDEEYVWWEPLWEFAVHSLVGTAIFLIVYSPAVALNQIVHWMISLQIDKFLVTSVEYAEYALIVGDTILFLAFLAKTTWRGVKKL